MDVNSVMDALDSIAEAIEVPCPHWLGGDDVDQGPSYCRECAEKHVAAGRAKYIEGGWDQDNDGCCHCDDCGRLLGYTLTDYGVMAELEHFTSSPPEAPISPELAYHLSRLLEHHTDHPEVRAILPNVEAALAAAPGVGS